MASTWRVLPDTSSSAGSPCLLVKSSFDIKTGYAIYVTDLTYIWSETLDRRQIVKRGLDENTSIDPSEDASQLRILLDKLQKAIDGADGTSTELLPGDGGRRLVLRLTASLPSPLKPLIWPIHLEPSTQEYFTNHLVLPLIDSQVVLKDEVSSLLGQIKNKDHVIGKLADKMESSGMDIGSVFPAAAGLTKRKGSGWENAGKVVTGLGHFDEAEWRRDLLAHSRPSMSRNEVIEAVFSSVEQGSSSFETLMIPRTEPGNWWEKLSALAKPNVRGSEQTPTNDGRKTSEPNTPAEESDDDFETQETPPHLKPSLRKRVTYRESAAKKSSPLLSPETPTATDDDETTDDDLDAPTRRPPSQRSIQPSKPPPKRVLSDSSSDEAASLPKPPLRSSDSASFGARIGGNPGSKKIEAIRDSSPVSSTKHREEDSGSETASEDDELSVPAKAETLPAGKNNKASSSHIRSSQPAKKPTPDQKTNDRSSSEDDSAPAPTRTKVQTRLGTIGGKKKSSNTEDPAMSKVPSTPPPKPKARLGTIGGKKAQASDISQTPSPSPAKSTPGPKLGHIGGRGKVQTDGAPSSQRTKRERQDSSPPPVPPARARTPTPEETEEDRANRKREELKKTLEAKSKVPTKKKRKF